MLVGIVGRKSKARQAAMVVRDGRSAARGQAVTGLRGWRGGGGCAWAAAGVRRGRGRGVRQSAVAQRAL